MTKKMITTLILASSTCVGFADEEEIKIPENPYAMIVASESSGDETPTLPPILEKCKKKKH